MGRRCSAAALQHLGIILQPGIVIADDIASGRLIRVLADHAGLSLPLHLLTLPDRRPSPKLRSFVELVTEMFKSTGSTRQLS